MLMLENLKQKLEAYKPMLLKKYKINQLGIFGILSSQNDNKEQNSNILIDYIDAPSLLDLVELENFLTEQLSIKVHIFTKNRLKGQRILSEVVYL
ncbi:DNA polymerase beta [Crocosphaera sp. UHCC 0190]|uniref:nucleotidyltransferase family protein n=1 Tax=Crocosphaera sp. UHCC 0190 TaxID=3110246 RepID=UPI002B1F1ECC|nr:DNA polymerase beta [Crocosphaera sp. UHCC 0190]MEA5512203.1 DNA polymerase beta [Crocosphaera sp. UHCC 0190]